MFLRRFVIFRRSLKNPYVRYRVLRVVIMKSRIVWYTVVFSPLKVNRRLKRSYSLHLDGRRINKTRNQHKADLSFTLHP
jgi:hypothetical protein